MQKAVCIQKRAKHLFRSTTYGTQLTSNLKLKFFKTNCTSVLLYWKVTSITENKIQVFINKMSQTHTKNTLARNYKQRRIVGLTKFERMKPLIKRRKWDWIGHTLRRNSKNCTRLESTGCTKERTWKRIVIDESKAEQKEWEKVKAIANNRVQ